MEQVLGGIAFLLPVAFQKLRAKKTIPEWATILLIAGAGVIAYWLLAPGNPLTREFWAGSVPWLLSAFGVNQLTSSAANAGTPGLASWKTNSQ